MAATNQLYATFNVPNAVLASRCICRILDRMDFSIRQHSANLVK